MKYAVCVRPIAREDMDDARRWYDKQRPGLGDRFLTCVWDAIAAAQEQPTLYGFAFDDVRRAPVHRFPYGIYYRIEDDEIDVLAVYHGSRDPAQLIKRI